jgi:hypothetical protein
VRTSRLETLFSDKAEKDFSEHPEKVTEPKHNGFSETAPDRLLNPDVDDENGDE